MLKVLIATLLFLFVLPKPAFAYLDPGTGSYLFQFVIAGALGGIYFFRGHIYKFKERLTKKDKDDNRKNEPKKK